MENRKKPRKKQTKSARSENVKNSVNGKQSTPSTVKDCLLNRRQMCESLGISGPGFDRWGVEPVERIGNQSFYDVRSVLDNRIEAALHRQQQEHPDPLSGEDLDPIQEQARLAKEKADAQALKNAITRGEQIPAEAAALIFGRVAAEMAAILDSLEANINSSKHRWKAFSGAMDMMLGVSNTGSKKLFKLQKTLSLAKAVATLPSAVIESFHNSGGYPWGIPAAAAMAAAGAAQIAQIKSTNFSGGSRGGGSVSGGGAPTAAPPSRGNSLDGINQFASNDIQQPQSLNQIIIQGDVIGDSSERFIEDIQTRMENGDLLLFSNNSRQAQELKG
ncbi:terminase small subunit [Microbulbifer spongiae]|uniref:Terminase small subunit n=1 Tax=Microbulbifer spongiae TaxID=2944933 RepID=A0ABY9E6U6_9GAMM|nr:hypothetical protein [Microbulbifer sp. MI-G]WKD48402.1 terminase small subunit [Microbulbifer sp. MI-G]